ncbi:predicted protein [Uncinocarpus reesii 1704]|uniref:Uncharacterized protein n=1 Tax=Uncinocarpus reesii (strain UAMH 1704) TaxID=336963 RepID=C4JQB6_UNCRE|nr:uncharacterized protein UREG_04670 [Uncinocarpus reesii 1704]EEP79824.1 predicted protein [Uncinocarpus reesii 1704]
MTGCYARQCAEQPDHLQHPTLISSNVAICFHPWRSRRLFPKLQDSHLVNFFLISTPEYQLVMPLADNLLARPLTPDLEASSGGDTEHGLALPEENVAPLKPEA